MTAGAPRQWSGRAAVVFAAGLLLAWSVVARRVAPQALKPRAGRNDIVYSTAVATPHVPWAVRLPGGPIRGFFVPTIAHGRDMVELMQRLSLAPTTVSIDPSWDVNCWGIGDYYGHDERGDRDDFRIVYGYVEEELTSAKPFEVIVLPGLNGWSRLTRPSRDAVLRRVREGAGLVLIHPFVGDVKGHPFLGDESEGDARLWDVSPLVDVPDDRVGDRGYPEPNRDAITQGLWEKAGTHYLTDTIDLGLIPSGTRGGAFYEYRAAGEVLVRAAGFPVVAVRAFGKGRVVGLAWAGEGFVPQPIDPVATRTDWDYWEYQHALLARAVLWAAHRESDLRLRALDATATGGVRLLLELRSARSVEVELRTKGAFSGAGRRARIRRELPPGEAELTVPASDLRPAEGYSGGRQIVDVIVRDATTGASLDFGAASFEVPRVAAVTGIRPNAAVYRKGDTMSIVTRAAGELDGLRTRVRLVDDLGRVLHVEEKPAAGERYFFYALEDFPGRRVEVTAELVDATGRVVDQLRHESLPVVSRERRRKEFQALMSFEAPVPERAALRERLLRAQAMSSGFTWGGAVDDGLEIPRGTFGVYWYDRGPTTPEGMERAIAEFERTHDFDALSYLAKKELFRRTGDTRFLVRRPCLDDPATLRVLQDVSRTAARNKAVYGMDYYFVGDEGSLGSYGDPVDFCFGPHTLARFREFLHLQYGSLETLNRSWGSGFADWNDVVPLTTAEAQRSGRFAPWADHRSYMETTFAGAYASVRRAVLEGDPAGHIALSGTQATTPWNGCDWHRLDAVVDDFLSYGGGNQWEIHRSFAKPGARIGFWTGYGRSGAAVKHEVWSAALSGVLFPNLFWSYSIVNPDLTFSRSGRDLGAVFRALRFEGVGRLLMESERLSDGVAIHYSMASVHAAGILGWHARSQDEERARAEPDFPADRDGWVRALEDLGFSPDFVASEQLEADALGKLRVLVLPLSLALSDAEIRSLRAFVEQGGVLIADGPTALFDAHLNWRASGGLDDLLGIAAPAAALRAGSLHSTGGAPVLSAEGRAWGLPLPTGMESLESAVRAGTGASLVSVGGADVLIVRRVGAGWTVYLNQLMDRYSKLRGLAPGEERRALVGRLLAHLGVRPEVLVTDAAGRTLPSLVSRYRFGDAEIVGVLPGLLDSGVRYGVDGVARAGSDETAAGSEVVLHLPRATRVVDARTGEWLGDSDTVSRRLAPGEAVVLGTGADAGSLKLAGPVQARRGEHAAFRLRSGPGRHLVRCHVFAPDGRFLPEYAANVMVEDGAGRFVLPTALNDAAGDYRVVATDVVSGATARAQVKLE